MKDLGPPASESQSASAERLDGWKEIAVYLKRDPRTVQRWEKSESLPVHRHVHEKGGTVFAFKSELDAWWNQRREELEAPSSAEETSEEALTQKEAGGSPAPPRPTPRDKILLGLGMVFVLFLMAFLIPWVRQWITNRLWGEGPPPRSVRLAVLPFEDLGGDADQRYFSDGLTQELIAEIGRLEGLDVIAWTTVRAIQREGRTARQIGSVLEVQFLLEGSVRRGGEKFRITAELVQVKDQTHLWAETFDRETALEDILALQGDIARRVAESLQRHLLPAQQHHPAKHRAVNAQAFEAYLKGRYFWNQRSIEELQKATEHFQRSIEMDPNFAPAHSGLADTYSSLAFYGTLPTDQAYPLAKRSALQALALDSTLPEAHLSLADVQFSHEYDMAAAKRGFEQAIELNPSYANAHHWYALFLIMQGEMNAAWTHLRRALELDPLSPIINANVALYYYYAGQYDRVFEQCRKTLDLFPDSALPHFWMARAYLEEKRFPEAIASFEKSLELEPDNLLTLALLGHAYGIAGEKRKARGVLQRLEALSRKRHLSPELRGLVHLGLGDKDATVALAEKAYAERAALLTRIKVEPILADLRTDPRFQALMRRLGFQE